MVDITIIMTNDSFWSKSYNPDEIHELNKVMTKFLWTPFFIFFSPCKIVVQSLRTFLFHKKGCKCFRESDWSQTLKSWDTGREVYPCYCNCWRLTLITINQGGRFSTGEHPPKNSSPYVVSKSSYKW